MADRSQYLSVPQVPRVENIPESRERREGVINFSRMRGESHSSANRDSLFYEEIEEIGGLRMGRNLVDCSSQNLQDDFAAKEANILETKPGGMKTRLMKDWKAPSKMIALLVAGLVLAIGHHYYYRSLAGNIVTNSSDQEWKIRFGTAFAFLVKACFAGAVFLAYTEHAWTSLSNSKYSVGGLNAIFSGPSDPLNFLNTEFLLHAKIAAALAAVVWTMPLSALVTPATLTIVPSSNVTSNDRALVPSIDFDKSAVFSGNGTNYGVAPLLSRIAGPAITGATILPMRPVHSNSAYDLTFQGPSLYCQTADNATTASIDEGFGVLATRVTPNDYVPIYVAFSPGTDTVDGDDGTTYVANASQTVADCILGSDPLCAYTSKAGDNPIFLRLGKERLFCSLQDTTFNAHFSASGNNQYVTETNYTWIGPAASGSYTSYAQALVNILNGGISGGNPLPGNAAHANDSNVFMTLKTRIMETALVSLVVDAMTDTLSRQQYADQLWDIPTITEADRALAQNKSLATLVEEMSRNVTLSLFSDNQYWHAYPSPPLPRVFTNLHPRSSQPQTSNVTTTTPVNRYAYASRNLFLAYGIAFFTTLVCVLTGLRALFVNEGSRDMTFSTIMTVTRNPTLDELIQEQSAKDVSETQLRFGALQSRDEGGARRKRHLGFGLPTEVMVQRKGEDFVIVNRK